MALFDAYVMVDWSAANAPKQGADSIWICRLRRDGDVLLENPATRAAASERLEALLEEETGTVLIGFDFPLAWPAGLAARLGIGGCAWRSIWDRIAGTLEDDAHNRSNRFVVAAALNRAVSGGAFPFWGCPPSAEGPHLSRFHHRGHEAGGLAARRLVDRRVPRIQPGWKLAGIGSAGSQALTGIPVVRRLRESFADRAQVWPFETGLRPPHDLAGRIVITEIYPSLVPHVTEHPGEVKDRAQVRTLARHLAALDAAGRLDALFRGDPALTDDEREAVEREEGWVLGVTGFVGRPPARVPLPLAGESKGGRCRPHPLSEISRTAPPTPTLPRKGGGGRRRGSRGAQVAS